MSDRLRWSKWWWSDWRGDMALRMCSFAARGLWIDLLALMHDAQPHGHLVLNGRAPTPRQLCALLGGSVEEVTALLAELDEAGVFSRTDDGVIYSRRMVRDMAAREDAKRNGKLGGNPALKGGGAVGDNGQGAGGLTPPLNGGVGAPLKLEAEAEGEVEGDKYPSPSLRSGEGSSPAPVGAGDPPASDPPDGSPPAKVPKKPPHPPEAVLLDMAAVWNEIAAGEHGLPSVSTLDDRRRQQLRARCRERWTTDPVRQFRAYVRKICASEFLTGRAGGRGWKADFDWALQPRNVLAVAEGKYHDGEAG